MTFSMLGRCARTGQFGVVVTTSAIAVGTRCPFARAGVGAALTQHRTDPRLGPLLLDLLARGFPARQAMDAVVAATPDRDWRQLAVIDRGGATAIFTGTNVRATVSTAEGPDCAALGNILRNAAVAPAMVASFAADPARPLAERLVRAILAGEAAGGETAAVQSAALLVVDRESFPYVDLRVDDHAAPLDELARLWARYAPQADDYVLRAVAPGQAAAYVPPPARP
ncbi:MAG: hypothetical protein BGP12_19400 [Rhodospirillales bacterium 70-18]|nr:MAG: hypothetical protein BGP12_19400 [Rhodospirillales bacterium 70-18]